MYLLSDINTFLITIKKIVHICLLCILLHVLLISFSSSDMCHGCLHDPFLQNKIQRGLTANSEGIRRITLITGAFSASYIASRGVKGYAFILQKCLIIDDKLMSDLVQSRLPNDITNLFLLHLNLTNRCRE